MRFGKLLTLTIFISLMCLASFPDSVKAQKTTNPWTNSGKSKYVKTAVDTFTNTNNLQSDTKGIITNQSSSKQLLVYFSNTDGTRDTASKVLLEPGKTLRFVSKGNKVFRNAVTDSVYSQIIIGDVQLNSNDRLQEKNYQYTVYHFDNKFLEPEIWEVRVKYYYKPKT